jgi:phosphoadenosine phosphosulfate reductase
MDSDRVADAVESLSAEEALDALLAEREDWRPCFTCSFQVEDMVGLQMIRNRLPQIPVVFLDTGYHFPQTYEYRDRMTRDWSLNLVIALPQQTVEQQESQLGILYRSDPTRCCQLRKVEPLTRALESYNLWFTGLRREQSPTRRNLRKVELHRLPSGATLRKVNLLADWTWEQVWSYARAHQIPTLSLYDEGYPSIGCQPCTSIPDDPSNPRSGRWGGQKLECGIHTFTKRDV